ncbi:MAG: HD domain-containing protein [Armatimonadetes bacterium]|nr:HD domain-containing protein [Armatimonadota bacterium]
MMESTRALEQFSFLFTNDGGYLRIPIWGHIPLSSAARRIIEHPDFVRLSKIRQLGFVHYVFPGASHTRFEHSIGAYHLSVLMLQRLVLNPATPPISREDACLFLAASLLHDIGHYPLAHLVDRLPSGTLRTPHSALRTVFESHEDRARSYILGDRSAGSIYAVLKDEWGIDEPERVADIISRPQDSGLPGRMLTRFAQDALEAGAISTSSFYELSDDALIEALAASSDAVSSGRLILDLKDRALYKRGFILYPESARGEDDFAISGEDLERVKELYWDPGKRREKEIEICRLLSGEEGMSLAGHEVLLDIPRVTTVFDVEDFRELRVLVRSQVGGDDRFVPFDSCGFSQLTADFAQEFERYSRRVQVLCRADLRDAVIRRRREIKSIVIG